MRRKKLNDAQKEMAVTQSNAAAADKLMIQRQVLGNENYFYSYIPTINQKFNNFNGMS